MTITLSPETEAKVKEQARKSGGDVSSLVESYVKQVFEWQQQDLEETLEALDRGMADFEAGRHKPMSETLAKLDAIKRQYEK